MVWVTLRVLEFQIVELVVSHQGKVWDWSESLGCVLTFNLVSSWPLPLPNQNTGWVQKTQAACNPWKKTKGWLFTTAALGIGFGKPLGVVQFLWERGFGGILLPSVVKKQVKINTILNHFSFTKESLFYYKSLYSLSLLDQLSKIAPENIING